MFQPADNALVEVVELGPTGASAQGSEEALRRRRLASCVTGRRGDFNFDLPPGRYELICSKPDDGRICVDGSRESICLIAICQ